jgi:alkanesulfonate monooxygenase SsuD/methylene tetrahydromethanopterin reductase-like flavin-dependent oxidoreductase (luciferase family)
VGIGLLPVPLRNPAVTAMEITSLARMFPGRFWPGLGHGVQSWMGQVGARAASPLTLLREHVAAVRSLLAGATVTVAGRYVHLDAVALDWPPDAVPPVLVGARGPQTVVVSGEVGDGTILDASATIDDIARVRGAVDTARAAVGRPGHHRLVVFQEVPSAEQVPDAVAALVARCAAAGADAVALQGPEDDPDPARLIAALARR